MQSFELNVRLHLLPPRLNRAYVSASTISLQAAEVTPAIPPRRATKKPRGEAPGLSDVCVLCQAIRVARYGETGAALPEPVLSEVLLVLSRLLLVPLRFIELLLRSEEPDCKEGVEYPPTDSARATAD